MAKSRINKIIFMGKRYVKEITRIGPSLFDIENWYVGEGEEMKKFMDFGFSNTIFVYEGGRVTVYYDLEECDLFEKSMEENLDDNFFNELCEVFFNLIEEAKGPMSLQEVRNISVSAWPIICIFDQISKYPEWDETGNMIRRLERVRKTTESFHYDLSNKVYKRDPMRNYLFFQGKIYEVSLEDFCKEKGIIING